LHFEIKPWIFFPAIAIAVGCFAFFAGEQRHRAVSNADLVRLLPRGEGALFFADFGVLRQSRMLKLLSPAAEREPDYEQFVRQTDFDYSQDIDALAGAATGRKLLFIIRGRFDWPLLRRYAASHGGTCKGQLCRVPTNEPGRWASFRPLQSDVMILRLGPPSALELKWSLQGNAPIPQAPVWVELSPNMLRNPAGLPTALRLFAIALQAADSATVALVPAPAGSADAFDVRLNAGYASHAAAATVANQLQLDTKLLKLELAREHQTPNPASLAGLLTSGEFRSGDREVIGIWPVREELIRALE
jgi:hypothetical protein